MRNRLAALAVAVVMPLTSAAGQAPAVGPKNVISVQPLNAMLFEAFSLEFERAAGRSMTWGIGGTLWSPNSDAGDEVTYTSGDIKVRYYPQGAAPAGFSFGGSVGFANVKEEFSGATPSETSEGSGTLGLMLEYQWLMGASKKFALTLGAGAKKLLLDENDFNSADVVTAYPTARVSIGWGF